jgi:2-dehydro-3-deoxygluconokinase
LQFKEENYLCNRLYKNKKPCKKKLLHLEKSCLRLATPGYLRFSQSNEFTATFGGGEANVAVSLANFGIPVDFVTRLPENDIGRACMMELRKHGVGTENIIWGGERLGFIFWKQEL